jgi:PIN domain nuclease of toxin-antitoxin system
VILLDTNVLIALVAGVDLRAEAAAAIRAATPDRAVLVSATTAWEIGLLATRTGRTAQIFEPDGRNWFAAAVRLPGIRVLPFDDAMALDAAYLPGTFHRDPADRWLVASARLARVPLVTRDRAILDYAAAGHVQAIRA